LGELLLKVLLAITKFIDKLNEWVARVASYFMVALVLTLVYEVVSRYAFRSPTLWSYDMTYMLSSIFLIFGMAYTFRMRGHVMVDLISERLPKRVAAALACTMALLLFFPFLGHLIRVMIPNLQMSWLFKERAAAGTWLPPIYPFKAWLLAGLLLLVLQGIAEFIKDLTVVVTGGERQ
jgi:TRAP-type mannitol/chloroaromatic compound transport system permease small subunit